MKNGARKQRAKRVKRRVSAKAKKKAAAKKVAVAVAKLSTRALGSLLQAMVLIAKTSQRG